MNNPPLEEESIRRTGCPFGFLPSHTVCDCNIIKKSEEKKPYTQACKKCYLGDASVDLCPCHYDPKGICLCHQVQQKSYAKDYSHTHCWNQKQPPACGQPLEKHTQCCLCDTLSPSVETLKDWGEEYWEKWGKLAQHPLANGLLNWIEKVISETKKEERERIIKDLHKEVDKQVSAELNKGFIHGFLDWYSRDILQAINNK